MACRYPLVTWPWASRPQPRPRRSRPRCDPGSPAARRTADGSAAGSTAVPASAPHCVAEAPAVHQCRLELSRRIAVARSASRECDQVITQRSHWPPSHGPTTPSAHFRCAVMMIVPDWLQSVAVATDQCTGGLPFARPKLGSHCVAQGIPLPYAPAPSGAPQSQMSRPVKRPIPIQAPPEMSEQVCTRAHTLTHATVVTGVTCMRTHRCTSIPCSEHIPAREQYSPSVLTAIDSCCIPVMFAGPEPSLACSWSVSFSCGQTADPKP